MAKKGGAPTKSEILATISKDTELSRKQVNEVFDSLNGIVKKSLRGNGLFTLPGLLKLKISELRLDIRPPSAHPCRSAGMPAMGFP